MRKTSPLDRISQQSKKVLVLSNGHGEDLIALRILESLHELRPELRLQILPLVGEGKTFSEAISKRWLVKIGTSLRLPSGGFSNQSFRGFVADILAGLLCVTWRNWISVKNAAKSGSFIFAVGDLLPLVFAWSSGGSFGFMGTPKSDYTWKTYPKSFVGDLYHRIKGTEWDPWEMLLMRSPRSKIIVVRDKLTARSLAKNHIKALAPGNPMMDGFESKQMPSTLIGYRRLLLLCGSRMPESLSNFKRLLSSLELIESKIPLAILVAIGSEPSIDDLEQYLINAGFTKKLFAKQEFLANALFEKDSMKIFIGIGKFYQWAQFAEVGLANAGTATEQLVGLGVPCVSLPGNGPQFKKGFALRQSRLLGGAVIPCKNSKNFSQIVTLLLQNVRLRDSLAHIGKKRMGDAGGSAAIANLISELLFREDFKI
ncbi:lipid-A-disaccharide synthase-related protein [Prochlorococcus marinus]|uniref:lipid-A-disaccharide synthase-related protein n=1 Tax=Prochlorococcus marinus TaxID=1219 RepID=UPI0022B50D2F|nr:lipid-A-disaccharide synthase-related protein [Prochlorococcus marinus]